MDYNTYDPEVPAGYQDADLLQAQYEEESREAARLHRQGICTHGWMQGVASDGTWPSEAALDALRAKGKFPGRGTDYAKPATGMVLCLECGSHIVDPLAGRG